MTVSHDRVEIVRSIYDRWREGDFQTPSKLLTETSSS